MVAMLADADGAIRARALAALAVWGRPDDERAMAALLDDKVTFVRASALKALAQTEDPEIIARVIGLTGKPGMPSREIEESSGHGPPGRAGAAGRAGRATTPGRDLGLTHAGESRD